jgi:hypothetical protein
MIKQANVDKWLCHYSNDRVENVDMAHAKIASADRTDFKISRQISKYKDKFEKGYFTTMQIDKIQKKPSRN